MRWEAKLTALAMKRDGDRSRAPLTPIVDVRRPSSAASKSRCLARAIDRPLYIPDLGPYAIVVDDNVPEMSHISSEEAVAIRELVEDLVSKDYIGIFLDGRIGRLTVDELRSAIAEYGKTIVPLPAASIEAAEVYSVGNDSREKSVDVPLWTAEEGQSDLTLSLTVVKTDDGPLVSIDDLHVL